MYDFKNIEQLKAATELAKAQVKRDIAIGIVPKTVTSFSELHNFTDANYYGDAFECDFNTSDDCLNFWNSVQDAVHEWLVAGGHLQ